MKSKITLVLLMLVPYGIFAQTPILVSEDSLKIGNSLLPALSVNIPEVEYEKTLKTWIKELQSGTKSKVITENGEMSIFGAKIKDISPNPINVYSKLIALDSMLQLVVSFELKKDQYIETKNGDANFVKAQTYLKEFSKEQYIVIAKDQADREEKKLRDLQKELSSLENEKSRYQKSIQSDNSTITSEKENIAVQNNELATVTAALLEQNNQLSTMEEGPAKKEKEAAIKDLEKRKKKALNSIESSENRVNKSNNNIDKANGDIPRNEKMQEKLREQIADQEAVYQSYAAKVKKIKSYR
jgi:peptidoglycan hydrolase CwlO-like protein